VRLIIAAQGSEEIDTRSPMGKAFLFFSGIWAQIYLENLREETLKGLTKKVQSGGRHISRPPLGYTFDEEKNMVIVEEEARLVREVYAKYLEGKGVNWIAKHMNSFSRGKEGGIWDNKYVRNILSNYTYIGKSHFKPAHWEEDKRIITNGDHEAIISEQDFIKVQTIMLRRSNNHMSKHSYEYAYGGIVRCANCGATYVGYGTNHRGVEYKSYRCRNKYANKTCSSPSISETKLTNLIFERLQVLNDGIEDKSVKSKDKRRLQKEVETSNKRRKNWMMALGDGKLSPDDYSMLIDEEDLRMQSVYAEFKEDDYSNQLTTDELKQIMLNLKDNWSYIEASTQKQLVQSMFREIVIEKKKLSGPFKNSYLYEKNTARFSGVFRYFSGGGGIRTPVRKQRYMSISERSHSFKFRRRIRGVTR
jgi:site-specific DNA recombinase